MSASHDQNGAQPGQKKPYSKPDIQQVELRPEEAVLASCKTNKISGSGQPKCSAPSACSSLAS